MLEILQCLKQHGQRLDLELAQELRLPLATVRQKLLNLEATNKIVMCRLTRFEGERKVEAWQCRVSGYSPPPAPGRKAKVPESV